MKNYQEFKTLWNEGSIELEEYIKENTISEKNGIKYIKYENNKEVKILGITGSSNLLTSEDFDWLLNDSEKFQNKILKEEE